METWKAVKDFEKYEVSDLGNIKRVGGRLLKPFVNDSGYYAVNLCADGVVKRKLLSRLITRAFHGEPMGDKFLVDHIDRNKLNNKASNLRWANWKDNLANTHWFSGRACAHCGESRKPRTRKSKGVGKGNPVSSS